MPLREVSDINARYYLRNFFLARCLTRPLSRLDAVQDIIDHPTFEKRFTDVAKGLPDLERIVSRIHAKNCKVKDFLKVLTASILYCPTPFDVFITMTQAFKKLSNGLNDMANSSETFESKTILGLLRSAPDLLPNIKNVECMYQPMSGDMDELEPRDGRDPDYDAVMSEIQELEQSLEKELKTFEKQLG
jgi:DNA mismatch repair protein MSH6